MAAAGDGDGELEAKTDGRIHSTVEHNQRSLKLLRQLFPPRSNPGNTDWGKTRGAILRAHKKRFWRDSVFSCNRRLRLREITDDVDFSRSPLKWVSSLVSC